MDDNALLRQQRDRLRRALAALVDGGSIEELRMMYTALRRLPIPDADKAAMLDAIQALLDIPE